MAIILTPVSSEVTALLVFYYQMLGIKFFTLRLTFFLCNTQRFISIPVTML